MIVKVKPVLLSEMAKCTCHVAKLDWVRAPCSQTMVSDVLLKANYEAMCNRLTTVDPAQQDWEAIMWDHHGVGFVEDVFTRPGSEAHKAAEDMAHDLSYYPCLDDELLGEMIEREQEEKLAAKSPRKLVKVIAEPSICDIDAQWGGEG